MLHGRLQFALARLNPDLPDDALDDALRRLTRPAGATLAARNRDFHRMVVAGVTVEYVGADGRMRGAQARVLDLDDPDHNDWLAVNQLTAVVENRRERRPDVVLFVNGLPLAVVELKNPADENATLHAAFRQLQTYQAEVPSLFVFNAALVASDGLDARLGTLTAGWEWFKPWRIVSGETLADPSLPQLQVLLEGVFDRRRLLALVRDFIVFEDDGGGALAKKMGGLPPVPRRAGRRRRNAACGRFAAGGRGARAAWAVRVGPPTGRRAGRSARFGSPPVQRAVRRNDAWPCELDRLQRPPAPRPRTEVRGWPASVVQMRASRPGSDVSVVNVRPDRRTG